MLQSNYTTHLILPLGPKKEILSCLLEDRQIKAKIILPKTPSRQKFLVFSKLSLITLYTSGLPKCIMEK